MRAVVEPPIESINDVEVLGRLLDARAETERKAQSLAQAEQRIAAQHKRVRSFEQEALYLRTWIDMPGTLPRDVALGPRNYLFLDSHAGAGRVAAIYALIGTAKLNGIEPEGYLRHVLERIADHPIDWIAELLPWNIGRQQERLAA